MKTVTIKCTIFFLYTRNTNKSKALEYLCLVKITNDSENRGQI